MKTVLQKYIAQSGLCSRRQAEGFIRAGQVEVNGQPAELGQRVDERDEVRVQGRNLPPTGEKFYIILHKPKGYVCTTRRFKGEKNVFDLIVPSRGGDLGRGLGHAQGADKLPLNPPPRGGHGLHIVGRLDKDSRGLVLLTNDGDLTATLTHPRYGHEKEYFVQLRIKNYELRIKEIIEKFKKGIDIGEGDGKVRAKQIEYLQQGKFRIILTMGKKRQIRRMFAALGYEVADLKRARIGNLELGSLQTGKWRILNQDEIDKLKNNLT